MLEEANEKFKKAEPHFKKQVSGFESQIDSECNKNVLQARRYTEEVNNVSRLDWLLTVPKMEIVHNKLNPHQNCG